MGDRRSLCLTPVTLRAARPAAATIAQPRCCPPSSATPDLHRSRSRLSARHGATHRRRTLALARAHHCTLTCSRICCALCVVRSVCDCGTQCTERFSILAAVARRYSAGSTRHTLTQPSSLALIPRRASGTTLSSARAMHSTCRAAGGTQSAQIRERLREECMSRGEYRCVARDKFVELTSETAKKNPPPAER